MPKTTLTIEGMSCTGCSSRVEEGLSKLDGVRSAEADHEAGRATVTLVAGQEDLEALRETVSKLGYEVLDIQTA